MQLIMSNINKGSRFFTNDHAVAGSIPEKGGPLILVRTVR